MAAWRPAKVLCTTISTQSIQLRPAPLRSVDQILRRRSPRRSPDFQSKRQLTNAARLTEPSLTPSSAGGDDLFIPFDHALPLPSVERSTPPMTPGGFTAPTPPTSVLHNPATTRPAAQAPTREDDFLHEPAIELTRHTEQSQHFADTPAPLKSTRRQQHARRHNEQRTATSRRPTRVAQSERRQRLSTSGTKGASMQRPPTAQTEPEPWQIQKRALLEKFQDSTWNPRKKVSPDAMEGIRALHSQHPEQFTTPVLAEHFRVSPEAIRRILKSKWRPKADEEEDRRLRWDKRGEKIWGDLVDTGVHAPKRWREMGIGTGPRRPAQDRSLREGADDAETVARPHVGHSDENEGSSWMQSLAGRIA